MGWLDADGYLFLSDRKIDMIITGGVNVYPAEIEAALLAQPEVGDVAVFGVPSEEWGGEVKAVVEPAPGVAASDALRERLLAHCRATRTASSTSASCATRTGSGANGRSEGTFIHLYYRRLVSLSLLYGDLGHHLDRLAALAFEPDERN